MSSTCLTSSDTSGDEEGPAVVPLSVPVSETKGHGFQDDRLCYFIY